MNTSERQALLSAFKQREQSKTMIHCQASGIALEITVPSMAPALGLVYSGLSPFASIDTCQEIAKQRYSESHCRMAPTVLAGILIVLLDHYELRKDKLSTTEANLILSRVPLFELSQSLSFLAELPKLSQHKRSSVPAISLSELDYRTLGHWRIAALTAINTFTSIPETTRVKRITKKSGRVIQDTSVTSETIKEARELLKQLREDDIINNKLNTILTVTLHKNNLVAIAPNLRANLVAALEKLGTPNCLSLAKIIKNAGQNTTNQEKELQKEFNSGSITHFPPSIEGTKLDPSEQPKSLLERIKAAKKQQQQDLTAAFITMAKEAEQEIEEQESSDDGEDDGEEEEEIEETIEEEIEDETESREELNFSESFMRIFDETPE